MDINHKPHFMLHRNETIKFEQQITAYNKAFAASGADECTSASNQFPSSVNWLDVVLNRRSILPRT
jgi:hypothetical protein